jgi:predicted transcriptional regulator
MTRSLRDISVREFMSASLVTFSPDTSIFEAIRKLVRAGVSGAPVVDQLSNIIGILSEKDCMKVALNAAYHDEMGGKVEDFMSRSPVTVEADTSILEVAQMFFTSPYKRYPVVHNQRLVGQISRSDVLKAIDSLG